MADTKISAITAGGPAQRADAIPISRSGVNYQLAYSAVQAGLINTTTVSHAETLLLRSTPKACGISVPAGYIAVPHLMICRTTSLATAYTSGAITRLELKNAALTQTLINAFNIYWLVNTGPIYQVASVNAGLVLNPTNSTTGEDLALTLIGSSGELGAGVSGFTAEVRYQLVLVST